MVRVVPVTSRRDRTRFIKVPWTVYRDDPTWVPPLILERRQQLSEKHNPFFGHARARLWIAYRDGCPVGRISAQVDDLHLEQYDDATGYFGMLEAVDDEQTFAALLGAAEEWLREQGMRRVLGPFNFSINEEIGLLVDGFDTPPMFLMPHGRAYYDARVQQQGYAKAKDVVAYILDPSLPVPPVMQATMRRAGGRIRLRPIRMSNLQEELDILRDIYNDAWSRNWGWVPFTTEELKALGSSLKLFVPPELVQIAEIDGEPAAMLVVVPNLNESIRDLDGHLFPAGWIRLLWRLKRAWPRTARVPLMGVRREYQRSTIGMALVFLMVEAVRKPLVAHGIEQVELSWILEDNLAMRHIQERLGARVYKTYRLYEKSLA